METKSTEKSPISGFLHAVNCASHGGAISGRFLIKCEITPDVDWESSRYNISMNDVEYGVTVQISFSLGKDGSVTNIVVPDEFSWTSEKERNKVAMCLLRYYRTWKKREDSMADYIKRSAMNDNRSKMGSVYN